MNVVYMVMQTGKSAFQVTVYDSGQISVTLHGDVRAFANVEEALAAILFPAILGCPHALNALEHLFNYHTSEA